ncbi:putative pre-mrna-splicing factor 38b [Erysiphe neolycopersici]|uniref:Putative pre-mrna-splicing factor 38b n=1 Tax=Erysiphe neolycopersici TaxID=212602 RepID=A0A420HPN1_9PEZI|nr:putative pre-mrna-splicing factor 38b [Erysiphe neolycopersici]
MSNFDFLTDEYIAQLLAKEAKESSIRYSAVGPGAYAPSKPPANKPKPNTRFLRNIIKDTRTHNAALQAKESAEARERLRCLQDATSERNKNSQKSIRKNQLCEIEAILGGVSGKRKRCRETSSLEGQPRKSTENEEHHERKSKSRRREKDKNVRVDHEDKSKVVKKDRRFKGVIDTLREREKQKENSNSRYISQSKSPKTSKSENYNETSVERKNFKSAESHHSHNTCHDQSSRLEKRPESRTQGRKNEKKSKKDDEIGNDSDPLDDVIGPIPAVAVPEVRKRGRGNTSDASGIDSRFSAVYNPREDIQIEKDDVKTWDQALEAFRDWKKFKEKGIERLRGAGFSEKEIQRLERGGKNREQDVRWSKPGESREWDRGKKS